MKQLGYKTIFWYGGFGAWQNVENFVRAQHFDEFRDASSFTGEKGGNAWGVPDSSTTRPTTLSSIQTKKFST